jgi:hypothetical protein
MIALYVSLALASGSVGGGGMMGGFTMLGTL